MEKAELTKTEKEQAKFEKQQEIQNKLQDVVMYRVFSLKILTQEAVALFLPLSSFFKYIAPTLTN